MAVHALATGRNDIVTHKEKIYANIMSVCCHLPSHSLPHEDETVVGKTVFIPIPACYQSVILRKHTVYIYLLFLSSYEIVRWKSTVSYSIAPA